MTSAGVPPAVSVKELHKRPRFPSEWIPPWDGHARIPAPPKRPRAPRPVARRWSLILLSAAVFSLLTAPWWFQGRQEAPVPPGAVPHTFWLEGVIERIEPGPEGLWTIVVGWGGKSALVRLDAERTSVYEPGRALHVGHLKPGQRVRLSWVGDLARSVEILRQPMPGFFHYFESYD